MARQATDDFERSFSRTSSPKKGYPRSSTLSDEIPHHQKFNIIKIKFETFCAEKGFSIPIFYQYIDKDRDRSVTKDEFIDKIKNRDDITLSQKEAEEFYYYIDVDGNGSISYKEFAYAFKEYNVKHLLTKVKNFNTDLKEVFDTYNSNAKGYLNKNDVDDMLHSIDPDLKSYEKEHVFQYLDSTKDGQISRNMFFDGFKTL